MLGVTRPQTCPHAGQPRSGGGRPGLSCGGVAAAQGGPELIGLPLPAMHLAVLPPPATASPHSPIPRPPCIRPPHRKLFLINENGKLGPHITSRDVLGSGSNQSCCLRQHNPGSEWPEPGRVLLVPGRTLWLCKGNPGPRADCAQVRRLRPRRSLRRAASVNSLCHLAAESGSAAHRSRGGAGP